MKKTGVLVIAVIGLGLFSTEAKAQLINSSSTQQPAVAEQARPDAERRQILEKELPAGVRKALKSDVLTVWKVREVYRVTTGAADAQAGAIYEIYLSNPDQMRAIARFDGEGNTVQRTENHSAHN